jgi:hypothetical protein
MFDMPPGDDQILDGASDEQPLVLEGVNVDHFRHLVFYLFPQ